MSMDPITSAIARFIGHFDTQTDVARLRAEYDKFKALQAAEPDSPELSNIPHFVRDHHKFDDFNPKVRHQPEADPLPPPDLPPRMEVPDIAPPPLEKYPLYREDGPHHDSGGGGMAGGVAQQGLKIDAPGSLAALIKQSAFASDNDYFNNTGVEIETQDPEQIILQLAELVAKATALDPLNHDADLSSDEGIANFINQVRESLPAIAAAHDTKTEQDLETGTEQPTGAHREQPAETEVAKTGSSQVEASADAQNEHAAQVHVQHSNEIIGTYINGAKLVEAPQLNDFLPEPHKPAEPVENSQTPGPLMTGGEDGATNPDDSHKQHASVEDDNQPTHIEVIGETALPDPLDTEPKIELTTGANLLVNEVMLSSNWFVTPIMLVMGNATNLDVISQINVWYSDDIVGDLSMRQAVDYDLASALPADEAAATADTQISEHSHEETGVSHNAETVKNDSSVFSTMETDEHSETSTSASQEVETDFVHDSSTITSKDTGPDEPGNATVGTSGDADEAKVKVAKSPASIPDTKPVEEENNDLVPPDDNETAAYNIAAFTVETTTPEPEVVDKETEPEEDSIFPSTWAITSVEGNLVFMNWVEQYSLISDSDTAIMSTSGSTVMTSMGGNIAINGTALLELGNYYDLVVTDGSYLNANIISQTNVLLDSDKLWAPPGQAKKDANNGKDQGNGKAKGKDKDNGNGNGQENGNGNIDTDGNLLWNQAAIHTIGKKQFTELSKQFEEAAESIADGQSGPPADFLDNELFAGLEGLRVLHITGNLLDLQYVRQTNVLGDSDQVAVVQQELLNYSQAEWTIQTGDNALVNIANIVDAGVDSSIMVGGEQYSDALLYQANLVSDEPAISSGDPLDLANEAVAFLADDLVANPENPDEEPLVLANDTTSADIMETMLS